MSLVAFGWLKSQSNEKFSGLVEGSVICPADGGAPFGLGGALHPGFRQGQEIFWGYHDANSNPNRKIEVKEAGQQ